MELHQYSHRKDIGRYAHVIGPAAGGRYAINTQTRTPTTIDQKPYPAAWQNDNAIALAEAWVKDGILPD